MAEVAFDRVCIRAQKAGFLRDAAAEGQPLAPLKIMEAL